MASAMTLMKRMEINTPVKGVGMIALDGAVGFGSSFAIGQAYSRYTDKWYGKHAARIAAVAGKLGAVVVSMTSGGHQSFGGGILNSVGQSGINAIGLEMGLRLGRKASGKKAVLVDANKQIAGATDMSYLGALGKAAPGRGLSWDQIEELAAGR